MERERLGKYELLERLGRGGMGEVWKARDTQLQRYVAIKLLRADLQADPDFVTYFMREARLVASLHHPNIVQIHDFQLASTDDTRAQAYMVMDYIEGGTLAGAIRNTVRRGLFWPADDIVYLFSAIGQALDYAHGQGMVHRDIKPANILLDTSMASAKALGEPILTDFGIARLQSGEAAMSRFVGTPAYISPEQAARRPVDARSDLYSLGIILYEVLTGVTPFRGDNPLAILLHQVQEQPVSPALLNPRISPELAEVVLHSIAKDAQERFPSATALALALARAFRVSVPERLHTPAGKDGSPVHNPLQPLPGMTPLPPVPTAVPLSTTFTPVPVGSPGAGAYGGSVEAEITRITPQAGVQQSLSSRPVGHDKPARHRPAWLPVAAIACVLLLLFGIGSIFAVPRLFSSSTASTPAAASAVAGRILFSHSSHVPRNVFDQVQVDLTNVPSPPGGETYYAWLEQANSEAPAIPHWLLQVKNGTIHMLYTGSAAQGDLYTPSVLFLVTAENAGSSPIVPVFEPNRHLYYALITHTSTAEPAFEVRHCPQGDASGQANPCR